MEASERALFGRCSDWARDGYPRIARLCEEPAWDAVPALGYGLLLVVFVLVAVITVRLRLPQPLANLGRFLAATLCIGAAISAAQLVAVAALLYAPELSRLLATPWFVLPAAGFAILLHALRWRRLLTYALAQIFLGLVVLMMAARSSQDASAAAYPVLTSLLGLIVGIGIVLNGLGNLSQWLKATHPMLHGKLRGMMPGAAPPPSDAGARSPGFTFRSRSRTIDVAPLETHRSGRDDP